MPIGTSMIWKDNWLWVACKNLIFVSDLLYPPEFFARNGAR
jgi:hypothetical protein